MTTAPTLLPPRHDRSAHLDRGAPTDLVLVAHGTRDAAGAATSHRIREAVAAQLPGVHVELAYVDVQEPRVAQVVAARAAAGRRVAVVPLLLSMGYHVQVDVLGAVAPHALAATSGALGPHPLLVQALIERLVQGGAKPGDAIVLAAAGSSRPQAAADAKAVAALLARRWPGRVGVGFGASASPTVPAAVAAARAWRACRTGRAVVASYLIGEGFFHDRLREAGADLVTDPLAEHPAVIELITHRYADARAHLDEVTRATG